MPNIINPNCPSLPQQVEKNTQDILKLFASNLEELSGLEFIPTSLIYQQDKAIISGKFIVTRDESSTEINGVVTLPIKGENGIVVDGSEDNLKIRIALDQSDRDLFNYVQELVNRTTESDEIVFTSDMQNYVEDFVSEATQNFKDIDLIYDAESDDINLNWGFTAGISHGVTATHDLSKYSKFIILIKRTPPFSNQYCAIYTKGIYNENSFGAYISGDYFYEFKGAFDITDSSITNKSGLYRVTIGDLDTGIPIIKIWGVE